MLRGFTRMSHGLATAGPAPRGDAPRGDAPQAPQDTPRYRFEAFLARGGMGEVWRGCDTMLAREVALKVLREQVFGDGGLRAHFEEEARHVSRLEHPSIVPVYDLGELPDGRPFFVMKLIHGPTLAEVPAARATPADDLARWVEVFGQVCAAVAFAHERGVVHWDLKPSNVMLGEFGEALAQQLSSAGPAEAAAARQVLERLRSFPALAGVRNPAAWPTSPSPSDRRGRRSGSKTRGCCTARSRQESSFQAAVRLSAAEPPCERRSPRPRRASRAAQRASGRNPAGPPNMQSRCP